MASNGTPKKRDLHTISDLTKEECVLLVNKAREIKQNPDDFADGMRNKTILMLFEKPSLRTRVSLESGMNQLGGHAIFYSIVDSPLGKMKENIHDTARTASRYVSVIAARLYSRKDFSDLAKYSTVPVINLLDDYAHPCQILADLQTIFEKRDLKGDSHIKLSYFGDGKNNVTYDLMRLCAIFGWDMDIASPANEDFYPEKGVLDEVQEISTTTGSVIRCLSNAKEAAKGADVIYTDTWMSYQIKPSEEGKRKAILEPYRVTEELMKEAKTDAIFMHCLPATRGNEMTAEVIDGPQSVVFDEAENRLHIQKAIVLFLLHKL